MQIVVPMAGEGQRFKDAGYNMPKPWIEVDGMPMIQAVYENLPFEDAVWTFIIRKEHADMRLPLPEGNVVVVDEPTEGAACTVLLAEEYIDNRDELLIVNADQLMDFNMDNFNLLVNHTRAAGIIWVFWATERKWSFVKLDEDDGRIIQVAEKDPISTWATTGVYYWRKGSQFVSLAKHMITSEKRVNDEFYVCPVYNELIEYAGGFVLPFFVDEMYGLGTPEDLERTTWGDDE